MIASDAFRTARLAVLAPHVVQYHTPIYRELARRPEVYTHVFYEASNGLDSYYIAGFGREVSWDVDLVDQYPHTFLTNRGTAGGGFFSRVNPEIWRLLSKGSVEAVLVQGYSTLSDWLAVLRARWSGVRVLYRGESVLEGRKGAKWHRRYVKKMFLKSWLNLCDVVLYSCEGNRRYYEHFGVDAAKFRFMPCCVDNDYFRARAEALWPQRTELRSKHGIQEGDMAVGMFARLIDIKRPADLIHAVATLNNERIVVVFVGDGPERHSLERLASDLGVRTVFAGFVNQSQIGDWYTSVDVMAAVSAYDPSPKAVNEAMNFGLPIVASDVVGTVGDLLVDGESGIIVRPGDVTGIARAIERLYSDPALRDLYGKRSLSSVGEWTPARAADSVIQSIM